MTDLQQQQRSDWRTAIIPILSSVVICYQLYRSDNNGWLFIGILTVLPLMLWLLLTQTTRLTWLLFALIPLSVPAHVGGDSVLGFPSEALLFLIVVYLWLSGAIKPFIERSILRHPLVILLVAEIAWMIVCSLFSDSPLISLKRVLMRVLFVQLFLIFTAHLLLKKPERSYLTFVLYSIGMIWPVIHSFLFHKQFNFTQATAYKMCMPFFIDHTIYGACIAFLLPMLLILTFGNHVIRMRGIWHFLIIILTCLLVGAEVLSFSRAAWVSLIVAGLFGILLMLRVKLRGILIALAIGGALTALYSDQIYQTISKNEAISNKGDIGDHFLSATNVQSDASNTERLNRWMCAWRMATEKPVTGFGPGMYQFEYGRYQERIYMTRISTFSGNRGHAHSEYFTQLSETGFPGALLFLAVVICVIGYGMKVIYAESDRALKLLLYGAVLGLITFYVHGIFNAFLDTDKMAALVFGAIAVIVSADLRQSKSLTKFNN